MSAILGRRGRTSAARNQPVVCSSAPDNRAEILRLCRRFLKDQEKLSLIYARKGVVEQKREKVCTHFWNLVRKAVFVTGCVPKRCLPGWPRPDCRGRPCDPTSRCPLSPTAVQWGGGRCPLWTDGTSTRSGDQTPSPPVPWGLSPRCSPLSLEVTALTPWLRMNKLGGCAPGGWWGAG